MLSSRNDSDGVHHTGGGSADAVRAFKPNAGPAVCRAPRLAISSPRLPDRLVNCWMSGATQQAEPAIRPRTAHQYPDLARTVSASPTPSASSTSAAEASANIR